MEGGRPGREGTGGAGSDLEELQWGRYCGRDQRSAQGHAQDAGGEHEWRQDNEWATGSESSEQFDA